MTRRGIFFLATVCLLLSYFFLYWKGLDFGRPFVLHPDERYIVDVARNIAGTGDYNPHFLEYPSLPIYIQLGISCFKHLSMLSHGEIRDGGGTPTNRAVDKLTARESFEHYYAGRMWMAVLAAAVLAATFLVASELLGRDAALFAVAATLFSSLFLEQAHYVTPNLYMTLFSLLTIWLCFRYIRSGSLGTLYLAAVMAGLGIGSKYPIFVVLIPVLASSVWKLGRGSWKHVIGLFLTASAVFLATTPYALLDLPQFLESLGVISLQYQVVGVADTEKSPLLRYFLATWNAGPVLTFFGFAGILLLPFVRDRHRAILIVLFAIPYAWIVLDSKVVYPRNLVPLLPIRAIGAAAVFAFVWKIASGASGRENETAPRPRLGAACAAVFMVACLWRPVTRSLDIVHEFTTPTAFQAADVWFESQVPDKAIVAADHFSTCPPVPCPGGKHKVVEIDGPHFSAPYVDFVSTNYLVSSGDDAYDGRDWRRKAFIDKVSLRASPRDRSFVESYLMQNRRLAESRLASLRVFDSVPQGLTEVFLRGAVTVYAVPVIDVLEWSAESAKPENGANPAAISAAPDNVGASGKLNTVINVREGEYDVFVQAAQIKRLNGTFAGSAPSISITIGSNLMHLTCPFTEAKDYFVASFSTTENAALPIQIDCPTNCRFVKLGLVRIGDSLKGLEDTGSTKQIFFSENLVANSDFDRGLLRWNTKSPTNDFTTTMSNDAAHGVRSLAVELKPECNLGIRQDIANATPGATYMLLGYIACKDLSGEARLEVQDGEAGWKSFAKHTSSITGTSQWKHVSMVFKLPGNVKKLALLLRRPALSSPEGGAGAIWFDNIRLHRIEN